MIVRVSILGVAAAALQAKAPIAHLCDAECC
jgi:hypothetical protein